jgi:hypothetical protein
MKWLFFTLLFLNIVIFITGSSSSDSASDSRTDKPVPDNIKLTLLNELSGDELRAFEKAEKQAQQKAAALRLLEKAEQDSPAAEEEQISEIEYVDSLPDYRCKTLGPVATMEQAEQISRWMQKHDSHATARKNIIRKHLGFWVILPEIASAVEAKNKLKELKEQGINDAYIFNQGESAISISLGLFNRRDHAENRKNTLSSEYSITSSVKPRIKDESDFWVDYKLEKSKTLPRKIKRKISRESQKIIHKSWQCIATQ